MILNLSVILGHYRRKLNIFFLNDYPTKSNIENFKNEIIFLAFLRLRKQDFPGTERWLNKIKNPESSLVRKQQGYFYYLHGIIQSQNNLTVAEKHFKKAIQLGLSMTHDLAMAKMSLAGIMMQKRRKREATALLAEAKKLDKHGMLTDQVKMMQQQMKKI